MKVMTRIFELRNGYHSLTELAKAMEISVSQIYRVREGKRQINQKFIVGAIRVFPSCKLDDLFYFVPEPPKVDNNHCRRKQARNRSNSMHLDQVGTSRDR